MHANVNVDQKEARLCLEIPIFKLIFLHEKTVFKMGLWREKNIVDKWLPILTQNIILLNNNKISTIKGVLMPFSM